MLSTYFFEIDDVQGCLVFKSLLTYILHGKYLIAAVSPLPTPACSSLSLLSTCFLSRFSRTEQNTFRSRDGEQWCLSSCCNRWDCGSAHALAVNKQAARWIVTRVYHYSAMSAHRTILSAVMRRTWPICSARGVYAPSERQVVCRRVCRLSVVFTRHYVQTQVCCWTSLSIISAQSNST